MAVDMTPLTDEQIEKLKKYINNTPIFPDSMGNDDIEYIYGMDGSVQVKHRPTMKYPPPPALQFKTVSTFTDLRAEEKNARPGDLYYVTDDGSAWSYDGNHSWARLSDHESQMTKNGAGSAISQEELDRQRELYDAQKVLVPCIGGVADGRRIRHHLDETAVQLLELPNVNDLDAPKRFSNYRLLKVSTQENGKFGEEIPLLVHEELTDGEAFRRIVNAYPEAKLKR